VTFDGHSTKQGFTEDCPEVFTEGITAGGCFQPYWYPSHRIFPMQPAMIPIELSRIPLQLARKNWHSPSESNGASKIWSLARLPWYIGLQLSYPACSDNWQGKFSCNRQNDFTGGDG
jgi:hypothetical protein